VALAMLVAAGCSLLGTNLETPRLDVVNAEMLDSGILQQRLKLRVRVQNPNARELPVNGVSAELEVQGERLASGVSAQEFTVPAFGESEFDLIVTANMAATLFRMIGSGDPGKSIDYRLKGKVNLASGLLRSIPFNETGSFKLE
jgi:LEA14-like dessication related protein